MARVFIGAVCSNTQDVLTVEVCGTHTAQHRCAGKHQGWPWHGEQELLPAAGEEGGERRGGKEIKPHLLGLLCSAASCLNAVFSFEVLKSHCTIS